MDERIKAIETQIGELENEYNEAAERQSEAGKIARAAQKRIDQLRLDLLTLYKGKPLTAVAKAKAS